MRLFSFALITLAKIFIHIMNTIKVSELKKIIKEIISESVYDVPMLEDENSRYGGWLDPDGKFHPIGYQEHGAYAIHVLSQMGVKRNLYVNSYEELYKRKFIRVTFGGNKILYFNYAMNDVKIVPPPSSKQMKELKDLAIERGYDVLFDEHLNKQVNYDLLQEANETHFVGLKYWWMDSHYKLHRVPFEQHRSWAEEYLKKVGYGFTRDVYKAMYRLGFVRLVLQDYNGEKLLSYSYGKERHLNSKQLKHIKDLAIEEQCTYLIDDERGKDIPLQENKWKDLYKPTKWDNIGYSAWWLEPNGTFHDVKEGKMGHWNWAKHYIQTKLHKVVTEDDDPIQILINNGWIKVSFNYYNGGELQFQYLNDSKLTNSLLRALRNRAIELQATALIDVNKNKPLELNEQRKIFTPDGNLRWWMDTQGKINDVSREGHRDWGYKYLENKFGKNHEILTRADNDYEVVYDVFFNEGWVRLLFINEPKMLCYEYGEKAPSSTQVTAIKNLAKELGAYSLFNEKTNKMERLNGFKKPMQEDMSYEELMKLTTPERKERAANVTVRSLPVTVEKNGEQWNFRYKSSPQTTVTDQPFRGSISFIKGAVGQNNNAMKMKCKVDCECPDFKFRFAYNDAAKNASQIGPDSLNKALNRRPKPAYDYGEGLCKHLVALSRFLKTKIQATRKSNLFEALDDVANQGPFDVTYYD